MKITGERPAEQLDTKRRHPRRKLLRWGIGVGAAVTTAVAGGFLLRDNKEGGQKSQPGGQGGGEGTKKGMPEDISKVADNPGFRQLAALALGAPESSIDSSSDRVLATGNDQGHGTLSLFRPDGSRGLSVSYRPRISQVGTKTVDSLAPHKENAKNNPKYSLVTIEGAEAAFYNTSLGEMAVFGSGQPGDNFMIGVQLFERDKKIPIGEGGYLSPSAGAKQATAEIAQLLVQEYFGQQ